MLPCVTLSLRRRRRTGICQPPTIVIEPSRIRHETARNGILSLSPGIKFFLFAEKRGMFLIFPCEKICILAVFASGNAVQTTDCLAVFADGRRHNESLLITLGDLV